MVPVFCWITLVARCLCNQAAVAETEGARGKHRGKQMKCPSPTWLLDFKRDEHSQSGEDGIIEKILEILPDGDKWCVEFGAWDGLYLTNTRHLISSKGFSAILIEGDEKRFLELQRNYAHLGARVTPMKKFVGFGGDDNLDCLLSRTPIPTDFDLLSIDIDGNDYHVWKHVEKYQPKVVVIEFNPTIPTEVKFVQPADPYINQGASLLSLVELGKEKGYELVCVLPWNAFFVKKQYYPLFKMETNDPQVLRTDLSGITYLFVGYDGKVLLRGACKLPWHHGVKFKESNFQILPRFLRRYPENYTRYQSFLFELFLLLKKPGRLVEVLRERFCCRPKRRA